LANNKIVWICSSPWTHDSYAYWAAQPQVWWIYWLCSNS